MISDETASAAKLIMAYWREEDSATGDTIESLLKTSFNGREVGSDYGGSGCPLCCDWEDTQANG